MSVDSDHFKFSNINGSNQEHSKFADLDDVWTEIFRLHFRKHGCIVLWFYALIKSKDFYLEFVLVMQRIFFLSSPDISTLIFEINNLTASDAEFAHFRPEKQRNQLRLDSTQKAVSSFSFTLDQNAPASTS